MARILVQTDDGKTTLVDEMHVTPVRLSSRTDSMNLLERLEWGVREAERRRRASAPRRPPAVRSPPPRAVPSPRVHRLPSPMAASPGFGRSFD